jgi:hypothetical protein
LHVPVAFAVVHAVPHVPQLLGSLSVETSQPLAVLASQSEKFFRQVNWHSPEVHVPVAFAAEHCFPQVPQFVGSLERGVSQPSLAL